MHVEIRLIIWTRRFFSLSFTLFLKTDTVSPRRSWSVFAYVLCSESMEIGVPTSLATAAGDEV